MLGFPVYRTVVTLLAVIALSASGCSKEAVNGSGNAASDAKPAPTAPDSTLQVFTGDESAVVKDLETTYAVEETTKVIKAGITTFNGKYTFDQVNSDIDPDDTFVPEVEAHFQADNYPEDGLKTNAALRLRGSSSRLAVQKSYRVKLTKGLPLWRGEGTLQLNKHPWDLTRVRNKLAFDLFREIPYLPSLRTQFMQVTINGADFGLFTHVEKMDGNYLANRGLATDSNIYKANEFDFRSVAALTLDATGNPVDSVAFERVLELENNNKNHTRLIEMLAAVNDEEKPFDTVFDTYFDRNNYLAWLAVNILTGNFDTRDQNFALHQPKGTSKFYFIPWDYDGAFGFDRQPDIAAAGNLYAPWQLGLSNWWDVPLHRRFLMNQRNFADLKRAVEILYATYLTEAKIKRLLDRYRPLVEPLVTQPPDLDNLPTVGSGRLEEWKQEYERLVTTVRNNYDRYLSSLEKPMPFWLSSQVSGNLLRLTWDASIDLQQDSVTYSVQVADNPDFTAPLYAATGVTGLTIEIPRPAPGSYFLRVTARDSKGYTQEAYNRYDQGAKAYYGVLRFELQ